jgi:hypothetical protein
MTVVGGGAAFLLVFRLAVLGPIYGGAAADRAETETIRAKLQKTFAEGLPDEASIKAAKAEAESLRKVFAEAEAGVVLQKVLGEGEAEGALQDADAWAFDPIAAAKDPMLYYGRTVQETQAAIKKKAGNMPYPESLGLPEKKPEMKELSLNLFRLAVVAHMIGSASECGIVRIDEIGLSPVDGKGCPLRRRAPVEMVAVGSVDSVAAFLHALSQPGMFVSVMRVDVMAGAEGLLQVDVLAAGLSKRVEDTQRELTIIKHKGRSYK